MGPELRDVVISLERNLAGEQLVEDAAEGVDICSSVDLLAPDLLRSHVVERSDPLASGREAAVRRSSLRQPEIRQIRVLSAAPSGHQDVRRLHVPVDKPALVSRIERGSHLRNNACRARRVERSLGCEEAPQVRAVDEAHRDVEDALLLAGRVHRDHVRVIQGRRELRLADEALAEVVAVGQRLADHLQRDGPTERNLGGPVDHAHAATANFRFDPEVAQDRTRRQHQSSKPSGSDQSSVPQVGGPSGGFRAE